MKQRILRLLSVSMVLVLFVTGCSGGGNNNVTPTPTQSQKTILIWWNLFEPLENVKPLIDAYQAKNPNVTIQYVQKLDQDGIAGYKSTLDAVLSSSETIDAPDIFTIHNTWVGKYEQKIAKAPADIVGTNDITDFYPVVQSDFNQGGVLGLPLYVDSIAMIYNQDKLIESGYSVPDPDWSKFQSPQSVNVRKSNAQGQLVSGAFSAYLPNSEFAFDVLNLLILQNGVPITDISGSVVDLDNQKVQDTVSFYQKFVGGNTKGWDATFKKDIAAFLEKKLAMYAAPSWRLINILEYNEKYNLGLNVGVVKMPQLGGDEEIHWPTYWSQTVAKESSNSRVTWDFIKFITQPDQLKLLDKTVKDNGRPIGIIYPRVSMSSEISADKYLGPYVEQMQKARNWKMVDGFKVKSEFARLLSGELQLDQLESSINNIIKNKSTFP